MKLFFNLKHLKSNLKRYIYYYHQKDCSLAYFIFFNNKTILTDEK